MTRTKRGRPGRRVVNAETAPTTAEPQTARKPKDPDREAIDDANARGPGAVAALISGGAKVLSARPKKEKAAPAPKPAPAPKADGSPFAADPRLPKAGTVLEREYKGKTLKVKVLEDGFEFEGKKHRSLSGLTRTEILDGAQVNGFRWWGLTGPEGGASRKRPAQPKDATEKAPKTRATRKASKKN